MPSPSAHTHPVPSLTEDGTGEALDRSISEYLGTLHSRPHTQRAYARHLRDARSVLLDPQPGMLKAWRESLDEDGRGAATHAQALSALRAFLRWRADQEGSELPRTSMKTLRGPGKTSSQPIMVLSMEEVQTLLATSGRSPRDRALLALLLGTGLKATETVALDVSDVRRDGTSEWCVLVRQPHGRRHRTIPLQASTAAHLMEYLAVSGCSPRTSGPLFLSEDRGSRARTPRRLSPRGLNYLVNRALEAAGIEGKRLGPSLCRHTFAYLALKGGSGLVAISKIMGHAQLASTQVYLDHLSMEDLRMALPALPPEKT